jgi:hypothetical protein
MKIRIKGASLRLRLSKSEVAKLVHEGVVEEVTPFADKVFRYAVEKKDSGEALSATFAQDSVTMSVPGHLIHNWDTNTVVTLDAHMPLPTGESLYLLLEKDFQCIDKTDEDQSDNYTNPNQIC